jgi:hypothetical protein
LNDAKSTLLFRSTFREYYEVVADSYIGETLINFGDKPLDMQDKISDLPVFGDTIYSPELFSDPNKTVESDDTTLCDNISDTLIASDNENDTFTSVSEEVDIIDNEHENIFANHVPCNDDIIDISSDFESDTGARRQDPIWYPMSWYRPPIYSVYRYPNSSNPRIAEIMS